MNILLVHTLIKLNDTEVTFTAVDYYRMQKPLEVLQRIHGVQYTTIDSLNVPDEFIKQFDLIIFSRCFTGPEETKERLDKLNIPFALDLDDYWHLPTEHVLFEEYKSKGVPELIERCIRVSHFITCTTDVLAEKIQEINDNVYVLPNGIDTDEWKPNKIPCKRIRFGFTGGTTHIPDVATISKKVAQSLYDTKFYHEAQIVLCGFHAVPQKPSVSIGYERMLTDALEPLKYYPQYVRELKILLRPDGTDKPYKRIWSLDINEFQRCYDEIDIVVAPLKDSLFNRCKSNIKMLEAGFKDCAAMVSGISPYLPLATKDNSFLLSEKNFFEWQRYILNNPSIVEDKKSQLKEDVKPFALQNLIKERKEVYESCIGVLK